MYYYLSLLFYIGIIIGNIIMIIIWIWKLYVIYYYVEILKIELLREM